MAIEFDMQLLEFLLGGWDDKHGRATRYPRYGHNYRTWKPSAAQNPDGGLHVTAKVDHIRGITSDDHSSIMLDYKKDGRLLSGQVILEMSGGQRMDTGIISAASAPSGGPYTAIARISGEIAIALSRFLAREKGGRLNFPAVIQENILLVSGAVKRKEMTSN
jgi:hypothetical protein